MTNSHNRTMGGHRNAERYAHGTSPPHHSSGGGGGGGNGSYFANRKNHHNRGATACAAQRSSFAALTSTPNTSSGVATSSSTSTSLSTSPPRLGGGRHSKNNSNFFNNHNNNNSGNNNNFNNHHNRTNGIQVLMGGSISLAGNGSANGGIPQSSHFAGSKCFDAPAPTALPRPPQHWTTMSATNIAPSAGTIQTSVLGSATRRLPMLANKLASPVISTTKNKLLDDFNSHNLKLLLNVQA